MLQDTVLGTQKILEGTVLKAAGGVAAQSRGDTAAADELLARVRIAAAEQAPLTCYFKQPSNGMRFLRWVARRPCCVYTCVALCFVGFIGVAFGIYGYKLDMDFGSFTESDTSSSLLYNAWGQARGAKPSVYRRLALELYSPVSFYVTYATRDGGNILTPAALAQMNHVEHSLRDLPLWGTICNEQIEGINQRFCQYGTSIMNFVYPSKESLGNDTIIHFNGTGAAPEPLQVSLSFAYDHDVATYTLPKEFQYTPAEDVVVEEAHCYDVGSQCGELAGQGHCEAYAQHEVYMKDFCNATCGFCSQPTPAPSSYPSIVTAVRSHFHFHRYCCNEFTTDRGGIMAEHNENWDEFVVEVVKLLGGMNEDGAGPLKIYYNGPDGFIPYETMQALGQDGIYALAAFLIVMGYTTFHTRNPCYALGGLFLVILSVPVTMSLFMFVTGSGDIHMLMLLSIFIVIAIGSDMIFVYTESWGWTIETSSFLSQRLRITYQEAGHATMSTTFTTAVSFWANLLSPLRALREFGFFMGSCVAIAWFLVLVGYPPLLIVGERAMRAFHTMMLKVLRARKYFRKEEVAEVDAILAEREGRDAEGPARSSRSSVQRSSVVSITSQRSSITSQRSSWKSKQRNGGSQRHSALMKTAAFVNPERVPLSDSHGAMLEAMVKRVFQLRHLIVLLFVAKTAICTYFSAQQVETGGSDVQLFHDTHNQQEQKQFDGMFEAWVSEDREELRQYQDRTQQCTNLFAQCAYHGVRTQGRRTGSRLECPCYLHGEQNFPGDVSSCTETSVSLSVVGREGLVLEDVPEAAVHELLRGQFPAEVTSVTGGDPYSASYLMAEHWESGDVSVGTLILTRTATVTRASPPGGLQCRVSQVCYCDHEVATSSSSMSPSTGLNASSLLLGRSAAAPILATSSASSSLPGESRGPHRRLEHGFVTSTIHPLSQASVDIVFGIELFEVSSFLGAVEAQPTDFFAYKPHFKLENPQTQRRLLAVCEEWPAELRVASQHCWILGFKDWWIRQGGEWPLHETDDFHAQAHTYAMNSLTDSIQTHTFIWFDDADRVIATYVRVRLDLHAEGSFEEALALKQVWDDHWLQVGSEDPELANPIHVGMTWRTAEATSVIVTSIINTFLVALGCVVLGVAVFTSSFHLAAFVGVAVLSIILNLLFVMTVVMDWKLGTIEVLSLIIFMGFAVDYCFHIAHKYHSCKVVAVTKGHALLDGDGRKVPPSLCHGCCKRGDGTGGGTGDDSLDTVVCDVVPTSSLQSGQRLSERERNLLTRSRTQERFERSRHALTSIGTSVLGSALTTLFSSSVLMLCEVHVFYKIGIVIMAVTSFALVYALFPLVATLMLIGPCEDDSRAAKQLLRSMCRKRRSQLETSRRLLAEHDAVHAQGPRRYILNMPVKAMGGPNLAGATPSRSRVGAEG